MTSEDLMEWAFAIVVTRHLEGKIIMHNRATREFCTICNRYSPLSFWVPDEIYEAAIDTTRHQHVCLPCFIVKADERLLEWTKDLVIYPVSLAEQRRIQNGEDIMHCAWKSRGISQY